MNRRICWLFTVALLSSGSLTQALAQSAAWPTRPIRLLVGFPAGGSVDQVARLLGHHISDSIGQPVVIDIKAGASGTIATTAVAQASPDGYTFGMVWDTHAVVPSLLKRLQYDTFRDLQYLSLIGTSPYVLVTSPKGKVARFSDLTALARAKKIGSYGSSGTGSLGHLVALSLFRRMNIDMQHIPYKGGAPMLQDTLGQQVDLAIGSVYLVKSYVDSGTLKALAVSADKRAAELPDVPTLAEVGVPGFSGLSWWGMVAPASTPPAISQRMILEIRKALANPQVALKLREQGVEIVGSSGDDFKAFVRQQMTIWSRVVTDNKVE